MKAFKCDACGEFKEGTPANEGLFGYLPIEKGQESWELPFLHISAKVTLWDKYDAELCRDCFLEKLELFLKEAQKSKKG